MSTRPIYSDAKRSITANDDGIRITTTDNRQINLPWANILGTADAVSNAKTLADMRAAKVPVKAVFCIRLNLSGNRRVLSMARELAVPVAARAAIEAAIEDYESRKVEIAAQKGIIIADTKFEFGRYGEDILLIDEILTPDSSRFWPAKGYPPGRAQPSFDKQYVRDYLDTLDWNKTSPGPRLPTEVLTNTLTCYLGALEHLLRNS